MVRARTESDRRAVIEALVEQIYSASDARERSLLVAKLAVEEAKSRLTDLKRDAASL